MNILSKIFFSEKSILCPLVKQTQFKIHFKQSTKKKQKQARIGNLTMPIIFCNRTLIYFRSIKKLQTHHPGCQKSPIKIMHHQNKSQNAWSLHENKGNYLKVKQNFGQKGKIKNFFYVIEIPHKQIKIRATNCAFK